MISTTTTNDESQVSTAATLQSSFSDHWLELRIALQRSLDLVNKFPIDAVYESLLEQNGAIKSSQSLSSEISALLGEMHLLLTAQLDTEIEMSAVDDWETIERSITTAKESWIPVVNKWHARKSLGTEALSSKLKVFNKSIFDSIQEAVSDERRVVERSRIPFSESKRICKSLDQPKLTRLLHGDSEHDQSHESFAFDEEVYDDKQFYSLLLRTFLETKASGGESHLAHIRAGSRRKKDVDRKASKGRKIRYKVHPKLQNFTFPIVGKAPEIDSVGIMRSLFSSS